MPKNCTVLHHSGSLVHQSVAVRVVCELLSANGMSLVMGAACERAGTGSALLGVCQFGLAFIVSSCVALGGSHSALPMSLGILIPAVVEFRNIEQVKWTYFCQLNSKLYS